MARKAARRPVTREDLEHFAPGLFDYLRTGKAPGVVDGKPRRGFARELKSLRRPRWLTPAPSTAERAAGVHFDVAEVHRFLRFARKLRHIKGRQFAGRPLELDLWQIVFVVAPVFGWKRADGLRFYESAFVEVPRKNGKSTLCAAIALYLLMSDREPGAEVISAARDRNQARAVFDVAAAMANAAPALRRRLKIATRAGRIAYPASSSSYVVISSDRGGLSKHGLNLHGAVVDELHVITDRELIETIETGTGSRVQPLIVNITTAGMENESPVWSDKRELVIKLAERTIEQPRNQYGVIYAADPKCQVDGSWTNPEVWAEANPGLGVSVRTEYIAQRVARAKVSPVELNSFLRLHLGVPTGSAAGWLSLPIFDRSASIVDELDLVGARCYGGLDLASSQDLAALVLVFPDDADESADVVCRFWTPADTLAARAHRDKADYLAWSRAGFLTATPGETINLDAVEREIIELIDRFDVESVDYDPWGSLQLRQHLEDAGVPIIECRQGFATLSPPMKETARLIVERKLRHGGHPVLRWCVGNTVANEDPAGNIKPDRHRSRSRIDGTVALIMAVKGWLTDAAGGRSVYEERDLEVV